MRQVGHGDVLSTINIIIIVTVIYAVTGYLGLHLATPPGYATAIWIPSGVALGAVLIWGLTVLPGVFLGSLLTNFFITTNYATQPSLLLPFLIGIIIATGATLQAYVGWYLVKRFVGLHNLLNEPNDILLFAFLSGLVSALVNATWSNTALVMLSIFPPQAYFVNWGTWWIGDAIGILIFTPVFLILFAEPKILWQKRIIPILLPLTVSFIVIILSSFVIYRAEINRLQASFEQLVSSNLLLLQSELASKPNPSQYKAIIDNVFRDKTNYHSIDIYDLTDPTNKVNLYSYVNNESKSTERYKIEVKKDITIANQQWKLVATPSVAFINTGFSWMTWFVLLSGLIFCAMINIVLFIINGQKSLAQVKMAEKAFALRKAEHENLQILRSAGEGIYGLDDKGCVTFINPAAANMLGYDENELLGKPMHEMIHHAYFDGSQYPVEACPIYATFYYSKEHRISEEVFWRKDGSSFWVEYTVTPLLDGTHTTGAVVVFNDVTKRRKIESELKWLARYDVLTGLPNRLSFMERLGNSVKRANREKRNLAVCIIDIDNFKQLNDSHSHNVGDETLKNIADLLKPQVRLLDYFARIGGDEFGIILENVHSNEDIAIILEHIMSTLKQQIRIGKLELSMTVSIGVSLFGLAGITAEELVKNADIAMYYAKESGKGTYVFYDEHIHRKIKRQNHIEMQLRNALLHKEFSLEYQIQVNANGDPIGLETLLRWHNNELGEVSPAEFIPIAEKSGLIYSIGEWVIKEALNDYKRILPILQNKKLLLSINVSVMQLENIHFRLSLERIMKEAEVSGDNILLEITETALMHNQEYILKVMTHIKRLGIRFALDDFGMSYSSLQYLKKLPVSFIKIDKGFIRDMTKNNSDEKIVFAAIQLSKALGIYSIAEGVERIEQYTMLRQMGCAFMQGYYFGKPQPIQKLLQSDPLNKWLSVT